MITASGGIEDYGKSWAFGIGLAVVAFGIGLAVVAFGLGSSVVGRRPWDLSSC
jgi:hypothetical protein